MQSKSSPLSLLLLILLIPLLLYLLSQVPLNPHDFVAFWSAPQALLQGGTPYAEADLKQVQAPLGYYEHTVRFWNPPNGLTFFLPFSFLPFRVAQSLWFFISLVAVGVSGLWLSEIYWNRPSGKRMGLLWVFLFAPVFPMLFISQITGFLLICLVGAIRWYDSHPRVAGILLGLAFLKPHLVVGIAMVFTIRAFYERRWEFIAATGLTLIALTLPPLLLRPSLLYEFIALLSDPLLADYQSPTLSTLLRPYLPRPLITLLMGGVAGVGVIWAIYQSKRTATWHVAYDAAILFTLLAIPYLWSYDFVLLLIPIFHLLSLIPGRGFAIGLGVVNILLFAQRLSGFHESTFVWVVPALLAVWLLVMVRRAWNAPVPALSPHPSE